MSELSKLVGIGKKVKLGEIEITIKPLTVSSMPLLMELSDESNKSVQAAAMKKIICTTLKEAVPDSTDEEIDKIPLEHMTTLMEAIMEINKIEGGASNKEFLDNIREKQSGLSNKTGSP